MPATITPGPTPATTPPAPAAPAVSPPTPKPPREAAKLAHTLQKLGLGFFAPYVRLVAGDEPAVQARQIASDVLLPGIALAAFLGFWMLCANFVKTESTKIPSPAETWSAWQGMREFARNEARKEQEFDARMGKLADQWDAKAAKAKAAGNDGSAARFTEKGVSYRARNYAGAATFNQQIVTSLITVGIGFAIGTLIAVPLGILCGLSPLFNTALTPLIQIFKPVSPLAWLPIVFVFVTALYTPPDGAVLFGRALFISAGTVTLCSLWPTLINTSVGVAGIDRDHINVARVLRLSWFQRIFKIVLPSALPLIFTGLRLSLGVGWMVLIAADMLAQNPGLGKFVWDTFQNGSTESMAQIVVAVFAIGIIGFFLDRIMFMLQRLVTFDESGI